MIDIKSDMIRVAEIFNFLLDMKKGDIVSVYADLDGICRKGYTKCFEGRKYFVGNGVALLSRSEIFKESQSR